MAGIAGYLGPAPIDDGHIKAALTAMRKGGAGQQQADCFASGPDHLALLQAAQGHAGDCAEPPLKQSSITLVFNGSLCNRDQLRSTLEERGVRFLSGTDAEVVLQSYLSCGDGCIAKFEGSWAFALFDERNGKLLLSRDRFGSRPLYCRETQKGFWFGTDVAYIEALSGQKVAANHNHLLRFLINGERSLFKGNETFFDGVQSLPAAHNLVLSNGKAPELKRNWVPEHKPRAMRYAEAVRSLREVLVGAIERHLQGRQGRAAIGLPHGADGIDSIALAALAKHHLGCDVTAYTRRDELNALPPSDGCGWPQRQVVIPANGSLLDELSKQVAALGQPVCSVACFETRFAAEAASADGCDVLLSGIGAGELLTGNSDHFNLQLYQLRRQPFYRKQLEAWHKYVSPLVVGSPLANPELYFDNPEFREHLYPDSNAYCALATVDFGEPFEETEHTDSLLRNRMLNELCAETVPVSLQAEEFHATALGLDYHAPFLDKAVVEFTNTMPSEHLIRNGYNKAVLRDALLDLVPEEIRCNRTLAVPSEPISPDPTDNRTRDYLLSNGPIFDLIDRNGFEHLLDADNQPRSFERFLFGFLSSRIFLDQRAGTA